MKRSEKSIKEINKGINKLWQPARTLEEARSRTEKFSLTGKVVNSKFVWELYAKCPEFFLFKDLVDELRLKYNPTFMDSDKTSRKEDMEKLIITLTTAANDLYKNADFSAIDMIEDTIKTIEKKYLPAQQSYNNEDLSNIDKYTLFDDDETEETKFKSKNRNMKEKHENLKGYLEYLTHNTTPIEDFIPKNAVLKTYLEQRNVHTLGDFAKFIKNKVYFNKLYHNACENYKDVYIEFVDNILKYALDLKNNGELKLADEDFNENNNSEEQNLIAKQTNEVVISNAVKEKLSSDNTELKNFVEDSVDGTTLLNYLSNSNVYTLADFCKFISDRKNYWRLFSYTKSHSKETYNNFKKAILTYYNTGKIVVKNANSGDDKAVEQTISPKENFEVNIKDISSDDPQLAEFYDELKNTPCEKFVKDSDDMKEIAQTRYIVTESYLSQLIEQGMSQEEFDKISNEERAKYIAIVNAKREQYKKEQERKSAMLSAMRKKLHDDENYKRDPKLYNTNKERRRENIRNFFHHDDGLNV